MSNPIVYFEIAGPDGARLREFYSGVFGWEIDDSATIAARSTGGLRGGIRQNLADKVFYVGVEDIKCRACEDRGRWGHHRASAHGRARRGHLRAVPGLGGKPPGRRGEGDLCHLTLAQAGAQGLHGRWIEETPR